MDALKTLVIALHNDEDGATATEYLVLLVLIATAIIALVHAFGETVRGVFEESSKEVGGMDVGRK